MTLQFDYPLATGSWICAQCSKPNLRTGYCCPACHAVLCLNCSDNDHERPMGVGICGVDVGMLEKIETEYPEKELDNV